MLARLPKKNVIRGRGRIWNWSFAIANVYSTKADVGDRWRCKGSGSVVFRFWGAGATGEAG